MHDDVICKYVDLQINGFVGVDFNDPATTPDDIHTAAQAMIDEGVDKALPTIITGSIESMCRCVENLVSAIRNDVAVAQVFAGVHIEGPFLSPVQGYIGAHPIEHALPQDLHALEQLCTAAGEWTKLVTLAPEIDRTGEMTKFCVDRGIIVAAGHTDASVGDLERCIDAGLTLFTHLGNGCPRLMDRHDNIIYRALRFKDRLTYSLIADGFHVPKLLFQNLLDWVSIDQLVVVSDAISAAGLGPGTYRLGQRQVKIGPDKAARDASGEHFVGAASSMRDADRWLAKELGMSDAARKRLLSDNPAALLQARC